MSDLSRSLVDAAAEADWQAHNAAVLKLIGKRGSLDEKRRMVSQARSRAAVAVVLETLAANAPYDEDGGFELWHPPALRGLARAVLGEKEEQ